MGAWIALTLLVIAGLALLLRADAGSIAGFDPSDFAIAVACVALLIFLGSSIAGSYRGRAGHAVRDLLTWTLVALLLVAGYSYREEIFSLGHRVVGELLPPGSALRSSEAQVEGERSVRIRRRPDGHFVAKTQVNGVSLTMLIDTGASTVVLKPADAQKLGIDVEKLEVHGAGADRQRHHLCGARAPAQPDARAHQPQRCRGAGGQARNAQGKPARYEFLKPPAIL